MEGIESSSVMLLLLSESSNASQQVVREVEEAVGRNIQIVPVIMGKFNIAKGLKYFINSHQWIETSDKKIANGLQPSSKQYTHSSLLLKLTRKLHTKRVIYL